jgi:hypothetical protein
MPLPNFTLAEIRKNSAFDHGALQIAAIKRLGVAGLRDGSKKGSNV